MSSFTLKDWVETKAEIYDLKTEYEAQVEPLVRKVKDKCEELGIPFQFVAAVGQSEEEYSQCTVGCLAPITRLSASMLVLNDAENLGGRELVEKIASIDAHTLRKNMLGNL